MSPNNKTIAKNASVLMASQGVTWILALLLTVFLPRYLGAEGVGAFNLAGSLWMMVTVLVTFGMDVYLVKEIARHPERTSELISATVLVRTAFFAVGCAGLALFLHIVDYPTTTVYLIWVMAIGMLLMEYGNAMTAALQGLEVMEYISLANIVSKAAYTGIAITVLVLGYGVIAVGIVTVVSAVVMLAIQGYFLNRYHPLHLQFRLQPVVNIVRASVPYLLSSVILVFYIQADTVVISLLVDEKTIGWYSAADLLMGTLLFVPSIFMSAVFPSLSRMFTSDPQAMPKMLRKSLDLMLLLSIPIGFGLLIISDPFVVLLFGAEFAPSGPVLALGGIVLIFMYLNILLGQFLISNDRQNSWTIVMAIAVVVTFSLDILIIPWSDQVLGNGAIGGMISYIITEVGMVIAGLVLLPKGYLARSNLRVALVALTAGLIMIATTWWVRHMLLPIPIAVGAVTYIGVIALSRIVPPEDIRLLRELAQGIVAKIRRQPETPEPVTITGNG